MLESIANLALMIFIMFDPIGSAPIFSTLLKDRSEEEFKRTIRKAVLTSFGILLGFSLGGRYLLQAFGMNLAIFQVAGGLLLLLISFDVVFGILPRDRTDPESISVFPMAYPLLAGPGSLAAIMSAVGACQSLAEMAFVAVGALVLAMAPAYFLLLQCHRLTRLLGKDGATIIEKLMGVLLTALSLNFMFKGIVAYFGLHTT